jgi:hypothetical protein
MVPVRVPVERIARAIAILASVWFAFAAAWGLCEIPGSGHLGGGSAGGALLAQPIASLHILYPSWDYFAKSPPPPASYYCHHPFGVHYLSALALLIFGKRDIVVHLPTVLMSICIPPLLFSLGRKEWGAAAGAAAACAYVAVPIAVGFSNYHNLETICIFGVLLFFWGLSYGNTPASLAGLLFACSGDWVGYLLVGPLLAWGFLRAFVLPLRWTAPVRFAWYTRWWAWSVVVAVATLALWVGLFIKADKLSDWLAIGGTRGAGAGTPLKAVLAARKDWIDFSFTPFAIALGKWMLPLSALRAVAVRADCELYSLSVLFGAVAQYLAFKEGADVHIFWPHYFAAYFALAVAQTTATLERLLRGLLREGSRLTAPLTLAAGVLPGVAMAPDAVRSLPIWRETGGRYDDRGSAIRSDIDVLSVIRAVVMPRLLPDSTLDAHPSIGTSWEFLWSEHRISHPATEPAVHSTDAAHPRLWVARPSGLSTEEQLRISAAAPVEAYGDAWVVDEAAPKQPLRAWRVREREPNALEWFLYGGWEPVRTIGPVPDPLATWELRVHLGQQADRPAASEAASSSLDDLRILHNVAVDSGDGARAAELANRILSELDRSPAVSFDQGVRLLGVRLTHGVHPCIEAWFEAGGPTAAQSVLVARSAIVAPAPLSLIPADTTERDMGVLPPRISTKLWRPGFYYELEVVENHRIGRERYSAFWTARDGSAPRRSDGGASTVLATLP